MSRSTIRSVDPWQASTVNPPFAGPVVARSSAPDSAWRINVRSLRAMYVRVWEYEVPAEQVEAFLVAYGPVGTWAQLFQQGRGYLGTELYQSTEGLARYVTVDRWTDEGAWQGFLEQSGNEYNALDVSLTSLGAVERCLVEASSEQAIG